MAWLVDDSFRFGGSEKNRLGSKKSPLTVWDFSYSAHFVSVLASSFKVNQILCIVWLQFIYKIHELFKRNSFCCNLGTNQKLFNHSTDGHVTQYPNQCRK